MIEICKKHWKKWNTKKACCFSSIHRNVYIYFKQLSSIIVHCSNCVETKIVPYLSKLAKFMAFYGGFTTKLRTYEVVACSKCVALLMPYQRIFLIHVEWPYLKLFSSILCSSQLHWVKRPPRCGRSSSSSLWHRCWRRRWRRWGFRRWLRRNTKTLTNVRGFPLKNSKPLLYRWKSIVNFCHKLRAEASN